MYALSSLSILKARSIWFSLARVRLVFLGLLLVFIAPREGILPTHTEQVELWRITSGWAFALLCGPSALHHADPAVVAPVFLRLPPPVTLSRCHDLLVAHRASHREVSVAVRALNRLDLRVAHGIVSAKADFTTRPAMAEANMYPRKLLRPEVRDFDRFESWSS